MSDIQRYKAWVARIGASTDNSLVRWDGIAGDYIKDSLVTLTNLGELVIANVAGAISSGAYTANFRSSIPDGPSAVAFKFSTSVNLSDPAVKLVSIDNFGTEQAWIGLGKGAFGTGNTVTNGYAFGSSIILNANNSSGFGANHNITGTYGTGVGFGHTVSGLGGTAGGYTMTVGGVYNTGFGFLSSVYGFGSFVAGSSSKAGLTTTGASTIIAVGSNVHAMGNSNVVLGSNLRTLGNRALALGAGVGSNSRATTADTVSFFTNDIFNRFLFASARSRIGSSNTLFGDGTLLGSELLTNGSMTGTSGWTYGLGWTNNGTQAIYASTGGTGTLTQTISGLIVGKPYRLSFTFVSLNGNDENVDRMGVSLTGGMTLSFNNHIGAVTTSEDFVATATSITVTYTPTVNLGPLNATLDNVSVKEILSGNITVSGTAYVNNLNVYGPTVISTGPFDLDDNVKIRLGTGKDSEIYYNGTDLIIDPDVVGSGVVNIPGKVKISGPIDSFNVLEVSLTNTVAFNNQYMVNLTGTVTDSDAGIVGINMQIDGSTISSGILISGSAYSGVEANNNPADGYAFKSVNNNANFFLFNDAYTSSSLFSGNFFGGEYSNAASPSGRFLSFTKQLVDKFFVDLNGNTTIAGVTNASAGSVSIPSLNFTDTATGFYRSALDEIGITINGTQRVNFADGTLTILPVNAANPAVDMIIDATGFGEVAHGIKVSTGTLGTIAAGICFEGVANDVGASASRVFKATGNSPVLLEVTGTAANSSGLVSVTNNTSANDLLKVSSSAVLSSSSRAIVANFTGSGTTGRFLDFIRSDGSKFAVTSQGDILMVGAFINTRGTIGLRQNLLKYSEQMNIGATWVLSGGATVTADYIAGPDGLLVTADRVLATGAGSITQTTTGTTASKTFTLSVWAKRNIAGGSTANIRINSTNEVGTSFSIPFNQEWQFVSVAQTFTAGSIGAPRAVYTYGATSDLSFFGWNLSETASAIGYTATNAVDFPTKSYGGQINGVLSLSAGNESSGIVVTAGGAQGSNDLFQARSIANVLNARITSAGEYSNSSAVTNAEKFGVGAIATASGSSAFGNIADAAGAGASAFAYNARARGQNALAMGNSALVPSGVSNGVAIGFFAQVASNNGFALGSLSNSAGPNATAIGTSAYAFDYSVSINSSVFGQYSIGIGNGSEVDGLAGMALGAGSYSQFNGSIVVGRDSIDTAANQLVIGSSTSQILNMFIGKGVTSPAPATTVEIAPTGGTGTAIKGSVLALSGGLSTGTEYGGDIVFKLGINTSLGSTPNPTVEVGRMYAFKPAFDFQGAARFKPSPQALGTTSPFTALVIDGGVNGGLYSIGRANPVNQPFTALSGWDSTVDRILYFGGGLWNTPDSTRLEFWTAPTYSETVDTGLLRMMVKPSGELVVGNGVASHISSNNTRLVLVEGSAAPASSQDPAINWMIGAGTAQWNMGLDNGDLDRWMLQISNAQAVNLGEATNSKKIFSANHGQFASFNEFQFNEDAQDINFRFEGTTDPNLLFLDAGANAIGIGLNTPTAKLHIAAQTATAGSSPIKLASSATLMGTAETGAVEYDGTKIYFTRVATRHAFIFEQDPQTVPAGGTAGQSLRKIDATDFNTEWSIPDIIQNTTGLSQVITNAAGIQMFTSGVSRASINTSGRISLYTTTSDGGSLITSGSPHQTILHATVNTNSGDGGFLKFRKSKGTESIPLSVSNGDSIHSREIYGHDGVSYKLAAWERFLVDGVPSTGIVPLSYRFYLCDTTGSNLERFTIRPDGKTGISVSSPTQMLDVAGAIRIGNTAVSGPGAIKWDGTRFKGHLGPIFWADLTESRSARTAITTSEAAGENDYLILCDCATAGGNMTVFLPNATSYPFKTYKIKKIDSTARTVTIDAAGSETIDGNLTVIITTQWDCLEIQNDGVNWFIT